MIHRHRHGFTLLELSIVLVIIGLVIGGIFFGKGMVAAAKIQTQVSQLTEIQAAVGTFRGKYNGLPGDLNYKAAIRYGMIARSGEPGHGDNNGRVESCYNYITAGNGWMAANVGFGCETALFWSDLNFAKLIEGEFISATDGRIDATSDQVKRYLPTAAIGQGSYLSVFSTLDNSYATVQKCFTADLCLALGAFNGTGPSGAYRDHFGPGVTPSQAYGIDSKIDDGLPHLGKMTAGAPNTHIVTQLHIAVIPDSFPSNCIIVSPTIPNPVYVYDVNGTNADTIGCALNFVLR